MKTEQPTASIIGDAIRGVRRFIDETTGHAATDEEIAGALGRYFVLNEIKEHILMTRGDG